MHTPLLNGKPQRRLGSFVLTALFFVVVTTLSGCGFGTPASAGDTQDFEMLKLVVFSSPRKAPEFALKDLRGKEVRLSAFRGKPLMLYFWATW
jgi:cytochrome oxidase Cu insertion factor (SCO1/SenC/PrrC family)